MKKHSHIRRLHSGTKKADDSLAISRLENEGQRNESDVTDQEKKDLQQSAEISDWKTEAELRKAVPDNVDEDGEPLNEKTGYKDLGAQDLDIPDDFEDDPEEELGKSSIEEDPDTLHIIWPNEK